MILTNEQILSIAFGAVETSIDEKGIRFYKCTEKQRKAWYEKREVLGERASGSTGVRLDFHTNSQSFAFSVICSGKYELYVDGLMRHQMFMKDGEEKRFELSDPLGNKKDSYRVTLYFPSHDVYGTLSRVELDDGATFTPHKYDMKWLFIGDSITQGWAALVDSLSNSATGSSAVSVTGVNLSPLSTTKTAPLSWWTNPNCPLLCPKWMTSSPPAPANRRWRRRRTGWNMSIPATAEKAAAKPTPCPSGRVPAGTICAISTPATTIRRGRRIKKNTGCRWICTSAVLNTLCCTCSMPASGTKCCTIWALFPPKNPSRS